MNIINIFCISAIPNHNIAKGMKAEAGIYRTKDINGSKNALILIRVPMKRPNGIARTAAARNPVTIL